MGGPSLPNEPYDPAWFLSPGQTRWSGADAPPPPPYHLQNCQLLMVGTRFSDATIDAALPAALRPTDERTGGFAISLAGSGWGIAPYTSSFAWIDVEGHDSSDGGKGRFHVGGYLSGASGAAFQRYFRNARVVQGDGAIFRQDERIDGISGSAGQTGLTIETRAVEVPTARVLGVNYYIHADQGGGLCICSAAFVMDGTMAQPLSVDVAHSGSIYGDLAPSELLWAGLFEGSHTLSEPKSLATPPGDFGDQAGRMMIINVLSQLGRAAILVGPGNRVLLANRSAELMLGHSLSVSAGRLVTARRQQQDDLDRIIAVSLSRAGDRMSCEAVAIGDVNGGATLLVQCLPVLSRYDAPAAVLLLTDPARSGPPVDSINMLQLLGLTPAESRIAALVGEGLAHRQTAERLEISEGTLRVALTQIYDKLGLSRASELAGLVSRLHGVSGVVPNP